MEYLWGIDLGGTKIEGVVLSAPNPDISVIARYRLPTDQQNGYQHILDQIANVIAALEVETGLKCENLGIGTPGTINPSTNTLKNSNTLCLNGKHIVTDLEYRLGVKVKSANDANCFALAEATLGAVPAIMPGAKIVFGIILGTGVGGGLVVNGQIINGRQGIAGEWGHNHLIENGEDCYCGQKGCVETVLSGPALQRHYQALTNESLTLKQIAAKASTHDANAIATIKHLTDYFGKAASSLVNTIDPDVIVIGGGVGNIDALYTDGVVALAANIFNNELETLVIKPKLGDSAGVFGAAMLWYKG